MQALTSNGSPVMTSTRVLSSSGRTLDLSKLTVLSGASTIGKGMLGSTSASNVVMITESPHATTSVGNSSVLVPLSNMSSAPITIVPRGSSSSKTAAECSSTVTSKVNVSSAPRATQQQVKASYTGSSGHLKRLETAMTSATAATTTTTITTTATATTINTNTITTTTSKPKKGTKMIQILSCAEEDEVDGEVAGGDTLTPAKILELPIIFAKDDDSLFVGSKPESEVLSAPIVVPIDTGEGTSVESTGDTISFPLDNVESDLMSHSVPAASAQDIVLIKTAASRGKPNQRRGVHQKAQRLVHNVGKLASQTRHVQQGVKYTKIILSNRHPSLKVARQEAEGKSGIPALMSKIGRVEIDSSRNVALKGSVCDSNMEVNDDCNT